MQQKIRRHLVVVHFYEHDSYEQDRNKHKPKTHDANKRNEKRKLLLCIITRY